MENFDDSQKKYAVVGVVLVVAVGLLAWTAQTFLFGGEAAAISSIESNPTQFPIEAVFENKLVYTSDASSPTEILQDDCELRGGEFNQCGSPCQDEDLCSAVCAYTCEF